MKLQWLSEAANDLHQFDLYHRVRSPAVAHRIIDHIYSAVQALSTTPFLGRADGDRATRALVLPRIRYKITYLVHEGTFQVLYVRHTSRLPEVSD